MKFLQFKLHAPHHLQTLPICPCAALSIQTQARQVPPSKRKSSVHSMAPTNSTKTCPLCLKLFSSVSNKNKHLTRNCPLRVSIGISKRTHASDVRQVASALAVQMSALSATLERCAAQIVQSPTAFVGALPNMVNNATDSNSPAPRAASPGSQIDEADDAATSG